MNSYDIEQTPMHFNKIMGIFACIVVVLIIAGGAYLYNHEQDKIAPTTETTESEVVTTTPPTSDTTAPEETTTEETTTVPETTVPETTNPDLPVVGAYLTLTESERLILATLIRLECGGSSYECQMAVASVVVNRMKLFGLSLRGAVFQKNVFSPARLINQETGYSYYNPPKTGAYAQCWQVVDDICENGPSIPYYVIYFRSGHYHSWATPYAKIGSLYFSYAEKYK
jgi:hypothetical protein